MQVVEQQWVQELVDDDGDDVLRRSLVMVVERNSDLESVEVVVGQRFPLVPELELLERDKEQEVEEVEVKETSLVRVEQ